MTTKIKFAELIIAILTLSISQCMPSTSTTIHYKFNCNSNDANSTMTYDNRFGDLGFEERGNSPGYLVSSFNYLEKGRIKFMDTINYYEGRNDNSRDKLIFYNNTVVFNGKKGTSRLFAEGFFPNNVDVSSVRAIRFEEFSGNFSQGYGSPWTNFSSKQIHANAKIEIGQSSERFNAYNFTYNSTITNGVVNTRDAMKLIKGEGSKSSDWEQTALIRGNISLENDILVSDLFNICGIQNWLRCDQNYPLTFAPRSS
jgi:hypothetical protein